MYSRPPRYASITFDRVMAPLAHEADVSHWLRDNGSDGGLLINSGNVEQAQEFMPILTIEAGVESEQNESNDD
jgi:hypothetical protein